MMPGMTDAPGVMNREIEVLRAENAELKGEVARLMAALNEALARIAELENQPKSPPGFVKANRPKASGEKQPRKQRAAEHNTSRKRSTPTRTERHALERCPECQYELHGESLDYTREVIELPPPPAVEVIEHQVVYVRTKLRLPVRQIQEDLQTQHQLGVSIGEIVELTHRVREALQPEMDALLPEVQTRNVVHADETGWREDGQNGYVWAFLSQTPRPVYYFVYHQTRANRIPQGVLGLHFAGHLVSDFYGAYNVIRGPHQRCWVHLLRDLHDLSESPTATPEVGDWVKGVRDLYDEGKTWLTTHSAPTDAECNTKYADLLARVCALGEQYALVAEHPCRVLAKRLLRHQDELFQFVRKPGVPADNNFAERALRPLVIMRKISGGSRSPKGSKTRFTLFSLVSTWAARGLNPFFHCIDLLQSAAAPP